MHTVNEIPSLAPPFDRETLFFETSSPSRAEEHLNGVFARHRLYVRSKLQPIRFCHRHAVVGDVPVNWITYGTDVTVAAPELDGFYLLQMTLRGSCRITDGAREIDLTPGSVFVMNPEQAFQKQWGKDALQFIARIDRVALEQRLLREGGGRRDIRFAFERMDQTSATTIARLVSMLSDDLMDPEGRLRAAGPGRHFSDLLMSVLLDRVASDSDRRTSVTFSPAAPHYVVRATKYIRSNALRDIRLSDIASAANVNCRTLNAGFRRFRDTTPMEYLRDTRLNRARAMLTSGTDKSVTDVAVACNLTHLGRFAQHYRERFGELPSETLRLAPPELSSSAGEATLLGAENIGAGGLCLSKGAADGA